MYIEVVCDGAVPHYLLILMDEALLLASKTDASCYDTAPGTTIFYREEHMYTYDMSSQIDWARLVAEAETMGRTIAHAGVFATRSDQVAHLARKECEKALKVQTELTNDPEAYRAAFVEAFVTAYFDELVLLRNHMKL